MFIDRTIDLYHLFGVTEFVHKWEAKTNRYSLNQSVVKRTAAASMSLKTSVQYTDHGSLMRFGTSYSPSYVNRCL